MRITALIFTILLFATSCEKWKADGNLILDEKFADELRSSPTTVTIGSNSFDGAASLWRDFMPGSGNGEGSPLYSVVKAIEKDSLIIHDDIQLVRQYVINRNEIWMPTFRMDVTTEYYLSKSSDNGPRWGPNEIVDIVIELENAGAIYRLLIPSQEIFATQ